MSKEIIKLLLILFTCLSILSLAACARGDTLVEQTTTQPAESVCAITMERVGQDIRVIGEIAFIDREDPEGVYADLEEDRWIQSSGKLIACKAGKQYRIKKSDLDNFIERRK